ncbi:MAG: SCO family protein [Arcobacter sp.]|nr:MAG: SCO family protein [Arcobacter sp.]
MKIFFNIMLSVIFALVVIIIAKPFLNDYKEKTRYDFTVSTIDGEIKKDDFEGKVLAIYFGYTFCPDVCPTTLSSLAQALKSIDKEKVKDFKGLFISVDPDRDTLKNLKEYAQYFHTNFIGATSNKENLDDIVKRYKSYYKKVELKDSAMDYSVSHTSYIYLFDKNGKLFKRIDHFFDPSKIKEDLEMVLK